VRFRREQAVRWDETDPRSIARNIARAGGPPFTYMRDQYAPPARSDAWKAVFYLPLAAGLLILAIKALAHWVTP
jgi:hypothetical protein